MSGYADPERSQERLSDAEREEAVGHLMTAQAEGRLTTAELAERSASARSAVTRGDLAPLFADLPGAASRPAAPTVSEPPPTWAPVPEPTAPMGRRSRALGGRVGDTLMALSPFVALLLFFGFGFWTPGGFTWSWLFFFLIPIAGIIIYGGGSATEKNR
ncbi:DUF1707 SHOCT-like domain-containing protein [Agromyces luteolus]|uniref:DUF1707 domain-containing protein n=1 Tax=Agromyces luteolus TaxID=88373 RepID=A0A7C9HFJ1_9MICO|nr:DUF1707 domain-containing protein [Agromyces luteolus]MUN05628.1 DUF1707 domain-containing protein [Agromyces luteolus]